MRVTPEVLPVITPVAGLNRMLGNTCVKAGVAVASVLNAPEPSAGKKEPVTAVEVITGVPVTQVMTEELVSTLP